MKTIILGKEKPEILDSKKGEVYQPFSYKVSQTGVSRKHATITIDDNNVWWLEDRWSTNGTYTRQDDGIIRKIGDSQTPGKCRINPMTFIKLGLEESTGCSFYAKQADKFGNFDEDFEFIENKQQELIEQEEKSKRKIKIVSNLIEFILPAVIFIIIVLFIKPYIKGSDGILAALLGGGFTFVMIFSRMAKSFYAPQEKKKEVEKRTREIKKSFSNCPNPLCNHILTENEIEVMKCKVCNIQHR